MIESIRNKIIQGDCFEVMRGMESCSVGHVISDPPYGLSSMPDMKEVLSYWLNGEDYNHTSGGFMNKKWDSFVPGPKIWEECFRVVKPGGFIVSFCGTRTIDLLIMAMKIAAANAKDKGINVSQAGYLSWCYGCLSDDSEILTENGWKRGVDIQQGERVLTWDANDDSLVLGEVEEKFLAPFEGNMVSFKNDNTDQLLTPNHRVYKRSRIRKSVNGNRQSSFDDKWMVEEAGAINRWNPLFLPLAGKHCGKGIGGEDYARLLGWIWTEGSFDISGTGVRIYQSSVNQENVNEIEKLMDFSVPNFKHYERERLYRERSYVEHTWFFSGPTAVQIRRDLPKKHPTWELLWKMTQAEKIAFIDVAMKGDGSWKNNTFYQNDLADLEWFQTLLHTVGIQGRVNEKKRCVCLHHNPVTQLQGRHLKASYEVPYDGLVWCVKVSTGAFVARRHGKVFITGNSGFPKSLNIKKQLEKKGMDPEIIEKWDGYGTALKPAHEPIIVFSRAYEDGTFPEFNPEDDFFYTPKASKKERNLGCASLFWLDGKQISKKEYKQLLKENNDGAKHKLRAGNCHVTVKPINICRFLCRSFVKENDLVLDPFTGSGTIPVATILEGCDYLGIELEELSSIIARTRVHYFKCLGEEALR